MNMMAVDFCISSALLPGAFDACDANAPPAQPRDAGQAEPGSQNQNRRRRERVLGAAALHERPGHVDEQLAQILERALGSDVSTSPEQLRQGVQMTLQQLTQLLRHHGIEADESLGRPFDPHYHEAVSVRHDPSQPDHIILETFQRGYRRGNEVFRPAKVVVNDLSHAETGRGAD